jgi:very-short-patch-repair endonuclease
VSKELGGGCFRERIALVEKRPRDAWRRNARDAKTRAQALRNAPTPAEEKLWYLLRKRRHFALKFRRQHPIGPYVADFYCHELKLIVELDGPVHDGKSQLVHDDNRDANLAEQGYTVLRFTNDKLFEDPESVLDQIMDVALTLSQPENQDQTYPPSPSGRGPG